MKTLKQFTYIIAFISLLISCSKEEIGTPNSQHGIQKLEASISSSVQTRVGFDGTTGAFFWTLNDKIGVTTSESNQFQKMTFQGIGGESRGTFTGTFSGSIEGYAIYPYIEDQHSVDVSTNVLTYHLPSNYTYSQLDSEYACATGNSHNAAMWAKIENGTAAFKHLAGVVAISVGGLPANTSNLVLTFTADGKKITGSFTADLTETTPIIATTNTSENDNIVTINFNTANGQTQGHFYIPVPTGVYEKFSMTIKNGETSVVSKEWTNITVNRCSIKRATIGTIFIENGEVTSVENVEDVSGAIDPTEDLNTITVRGEVANMAEITLPDFTSAGIDGKTISIILENVADGANITFKESGTTASNIELSIPSDENATINIELPNSSVNITGGESITYGTINAKTAENTLILEDGITIKNLNIIGGNVRVYGIINNISRHVGNTSEQTVLFVEDGAEIPDNIEDEKIVTIYDESKWDGVKNYKPKYESSTKTYYVENGYQLAWIAKYVNNGNNLSGEIIILENDIDLDNKQWTPIGFNDDSYVQTTTTPFKGTLNGNNKVIKNLKMNYENRGGLGLFGAVNDATFQNVIIENVDIKAIDATNSNTSGDHMAGGWIGSIAGYDTGGSISFNNCHVRGLIKIEGDVVNKSGQRVAGIIGGKSGGTSFTFNNITVKGDEGSYIKGYCSTAGIMGQNQAVGTFKNIQTDIDITCFSFGAGGLVGIVKHGSTFENCSSAGNITRTNPLAATSNSLYRIGGIAGCWSDSATGTLTLTNCSYTGTLTSYDSNNALLENFDYDGYIGRGYTTRNCAGSTVNIDGKKFIQNNNDTFPTYTVEETTN